jgi:lipoprotein-releasing system permease protein
MYKLLLCLNYLRTRAIAYLAVAGVALCVAMLVIVTNVMTGFANKVERAARGLFGDIIFLQTGDSGLPYYDEWIDHLVEHVPEVEAASPRIQSYAMLRIPGQPGYRKAVQVVGIRLPDVCDVSDFELGLWVQAGSAAPTFNPSAQTMLDTLNAELAYIERRMSELEFDNSPEAIETLDQLDLANYYLGLSRQNIDHAAINAEAVQIIEQALIDIDMAGGNCREALAGLQDRLGVQIDQANGSTTLGRARRDTLRTIRSRVMMAINMDDPTGLEELLEERRNRMVEPMPDHIILGQGTEGLSWETREGRLLRFMGPGSKVILYVFPLGDASMMDMSPNPRRFTVVDECGTDVAAIDRRTVYIPFDVAQELSRMDASGEQPARCSLVQIKVRGNIHNEEHLRTICTRIMEEWEVFAAATFGPESDFNQHPDVRAVTWRQQQEDLIRNIEAQRALAITMIAVISVVAVILVFVIFYMIVAQKTRDIGVLKAIGASNMGVTGIFIVYGAAIGFVGSVIGAIGGYVFVHNINAIQDWLDKSIGFRVWTQKQHIFKEIPNEIDPWSMVVIMICAILAGMAGALVPAIRAGRMQPVEALRYE